MEAAFFVFGIVPYWLSLSMRDKTAAYWLLLIWCCAVFIAYQTAHEAWAGVVNGCVEMGIAAVMLRRLRR